MKRLSALIINKGDSLNIQLANDGKGKFTMALYPKVADRDVTPLVMTNDIKTLDKELSFVLQSMTTHVLSSAEQLAEWKAKEDKALAEKKPKPTKETAAAKKTRLAKEKKEAEGKEKGGNLLDLKFSNESKTD